ncbi:MAG TPA: sensor domain-containing diguanylate cyclase [Pyrinomonadaceae bacterium]
MSKQVVLLTNSPEPCAQDLTEALRGTGISVLVGVECAADNAAGTNGNGHSKGQHDTPPLAVVYEVEGGAEVIEVHAAVEFASSSWPDSPLVALRRASNGHVAPDDSALRRLGFSAVAESAAQLPALLREVEERGTTGQLRLPKDCEGPEKILTPPLPDGLEARALYASFQLVASLHSLSDQKSTALKAVEGLESIVRSDRSVIYLSSEGRSAGDVRLELLALRVQAGGAQESLEVGSLTTKQDDLVNLARVESALAREAAMRMMSVNGSENGRHILALPLVSGERVVGVLEVAREFERGRAFSGREEATLSALASPISYALANSARIAEAERLSQIDDLTKLHNARYLRQFLLGEIKRARRYNSSVSALFFDIDDFKLINDQHGHLVGSHVLMEMAAVALRSVRDTDMVARYGGDEFVVVLPETPIDSALYVAERVREKIESHEFTGGRGLSIRITASFGVAAFPQHAPSPQQLVACADAAMYEAKAAGKNCVHTPAEDPKAESKRTRKSVLEEVRPLAARVGRGR